MSKFRLRADGLTWRQIDDELVAVDIETSNYLSANTSGAELWAALAEGATREALIDVLVQTFGIELDPASVDVDTFLADLSEKGLLVSE